MCAPSLSKKQVQLGLLTDLPSYNGLHSFHVSCHFVTLFARQPSSIDQRQSMYYLDPSSSIYSYRKRSSFSPDLSLSYVGWYVYLVPQKRGSHFGFRGRHD
jgi:hypothetical protein